MPNLKSAITDLAYRIITLSSFYATDKEFLEKCGISNHSLITDLKKGRIKYPGADILAAIVRGTGCSGTWLLIGEGEMFEISRIGPNGMAPARVRNTIQLIEKINQKADGESNKSVFPEDFDLQLTRLLTKILEHRRYSK